MSTTQTRIALTGLRWALGVVILIEAILLVLPSSAPGFARTHMPDFIRLAVGWGEIVGCVLMLIPRTAIRGAWLLLAFIVVAIVIHLLHGMYEVGNLLVYSAAAWAVAVGLSG